MLHLVHNARYLFQSTLPARGATEWFIPMRITSGNFNPRSPHGERLNCFRHRPGIDTFQSTLPARGATFWRFAHVANSDNISIHAPRTGSDVTVYNKWFCRFQFQSTLPARGATQHPMNPLCAETISIHAPRTGSDESSISPSTCHTKFQSTLPARGATTSPAMRRKLS